MAVNTNLVLAGRNMVSYTAAYNASNAAPADTVVAGAAWGTPWVDSGAVREGLHFRSNLQRQNINVDQVLDPVLRILQGRDLRLQTRLAQVSAANIKAGIGQGTLSTGTGSNILDVVVSTSDVFFSAGFEMASPAGSYMVRTIGWKGVVEGDSAMDFAVTDPAAVGLSYGLVPDGSVTPARIVEFRDIGTGATG